MNPKVVEAKVVREITNQIWNSQERVIDLEEQCERLLRKNLPNLSDLEVCDVLEDVERKVKLHLKKQIAEYKEKGTTPRYEFSEVGNILYRARDIGIDEIISKIQTMNWRRFEHLCKYLLEINGVEKTEVGKGIKEGGLDFFGLLKMEKFSQKILLKGIEIRVFGQARHHSGSDKVGDPEVNLFAEQLEDFKKEKGRAYEKAPDWFTNIKSPVIGMFVTNTEFTQDAAVVAKEKGIITKNGDQIAEDLFNSPKWNEWLST